MEYFWKLTGQFWWIPFFFYFTAPEKKEKFELLNLKKTSFPKI